MNCVGFLGVNVKHLHVGTSTMFIVMQVISMLEEKNQTGCRRKKRNRKCFARGTYEIVLLVYSF